MPAIGLFDPSLAKCFYGTRKQDAIVIKKENMRRASCQRSMDANILRRRNTHIALHINSLHIDVPLDGFDSSAMRVVDYHNAIGLLHCRGKHGGELVRVGFKGHDHCDYADSVILR